MLIKVFIGLVISLFESVLMDETTHSLGIQISRVLRIKDALHLAHLILIGIAVDIFFLFSIIWNYKVRQGIFHVRCIIVFDICRDSWLVS